MIKTYSLAKDGEKQLTEHFKIREFACKDGSDKILHDPRLSELLEKIRKHIGKPITITSAYRTVTYNKKEGGTSGSQHTKGTAADIVVKGIDPLEIAKIAEYYMGPTGGIGYYPFSRFVHVDVRKNMSRWQELKNKKTVARGRFDTKGIKKEGDEKKMPKVIAEKQKCAVLFDGKKLEFEDCYNIDGNNFVKLRELEKLGFSVSYDGKTKEISINSK